MTTPATPPPPAPVPPESIPCPFCGTLPFWENDEGMNYLFCDSPTKDCPMGGINVLPSLWATRAPLPAEPGAWFSSTRDRSHVVALCAGHSYLADDRWEKSRGDLTDLPDSPEVGLCCVCNGLCDVKGWRGKPMKPAESGPAEPTASESSGDVHLRQALEERDEARLQVGDLLDQVKQAYDERDACQSGLESVKHELAAAHTKLAEAQQLAEASDNDADAYKAQRDAALANLQRLVHLYEKQYDDAGEHRPDWLTNALLATPSPAPVAGNQIADAREGQSGPVIPDALKIGAPQHEQAGESLPSATSAVGEKDSAGPTPESLLMMNTALIESLSLQHPIMKVWSDVRGFVGRMCETLNAKDLQLTASESLRREAEADKARLDWLDKNAREIIACNGEEDGLIVYYGGDDGTVRQGIDAARLTPPVAGEGGEG